MPKFNLNTLLLAVCLLTASPAALAYLDPSTSGMIISAIVGLFASVALALKTYWYKIKAFFRSDKGAGDDHTAGPGGKVPDQRGD
jgi:hypothetical protein